MTVDDVEMDQLVHFVLNHLVPADDVRPVLDTAFSIQTQLNSEDGTERRRRFYHASEDDVD